VFPIGGAIFLRAAMAATQSAKTRLDKGRRRI
jgi:hypothetical protein